MDLFDIVKGLLADSSVKLEDDQSVRVVIDCVVQGQEQLRIAWLKEDKSA
jgi:hypothetical protein